MPGKAGVNRRREMRALAVAFCQLRKGGEADRVSRLRVDFAGGSFDPEMAIFPQRGAGNEFKPPAENNLACCSMAWNFQEEQPAGSP